MCFAPQLPPIAAMPTPPNPNAAALTAQDDLIRRQRAAFASRGSTIKSSPTGDAGYGSNVQQTKLVA